MDKYLAKLLIMGAMLDGPSTKYKETDPSTKKKRNECPECGEIHFNQNKLCCSPECYKALRKRQKQQNH